MVSGDGDLVVMSPSIGVLADFAPQRDPVRREQLLPGPLLESWVMLDDRLRESGIRQHLELQFTRENGSHAHVEGHGSILESQPDTRVWTWRDVSERVEFEKQLTHQAFHDPLTGMANRGPSARPGRARATGSRPHQRTGHPHVL